MFKKLKNIFSPSNTSLITELVISDFKLRYQNSVLGYLWSLLRPLMMFGVLYIVFTKVIRVGTGIEFYPQYLLLGLVIWTFFVEATTNGMNAITGRGDLVRKVSIPKYTIVIATTMSAFVNFILNMVVVVVFMIAGGVEVGQTVVFLPIIIAQLFVFCLAISFLLSALYVKYRDFSHIWEVALQVLFYATPIIYVFSIVPPKFAKLMSLSPLTQIIQDARSVLITKDTLTVNEIIGSQYARVGTILITLIILIVGALYFRSNSHKFAEEL